MPPCWLLFCLAFSTFRAYQPATIVSTSGRSLLLSVSCCRLRATSCICLSGLVRQQGHSMPADTSSQRQPTDMNHVATLHLSGALVRSAVVSFWKRGKIGGNKHTYAAVALLLTLLAPWMEANACSCGRPPLQALYKESTRVFLGDVVKIEVLTGNPVRGHWRARSWMACRTTLSSAPPIHFS